MNTARLHSAIVMVRVTNRIVRRIVTEMQRFFHARKNRESTKEISYFVAATRVRVNRI